MLLHGLQTMSVWCLWIWTFAAYMTAYPAGHRMLARHPPYAALSHARQRYVVSNMLKACVLCMFAVVLVDVVCEAAFRLRWDGAMLKILAPIYVNLDVVSLIMVPEMAVTTQHHHVLVGLFGVLVAFFPVDPGTYAGQIALYAVFSMLAYQVNGLLALRMLARPDSDRFISGLARACGAVYFVICVWHWTVQLYCAWIYDLWVLPVLLYVFIKDDIVLMRWLFTWTPRVTDGAPLAAASVP
jgi:hypothetical protein